MSDSELHDLLYPRDGGGREERLKRLRKLLDDPRERAALEDYLARRMREREEARHNADAVWERVAHGGSATGSADSLSAAEADIGHAARPTEDSELAALSEQLAAGLGARTPRALPLPVRIWVPALLGIVLGALGMWMVYSVLPQVMARQHGSFAAALNALIIQEQPSADELSAIDAVLQQYDSEQASGQLATRVAVTGKVYDLLREYHPTPSDIREARKLTGVYTPPDG